MPEEEASGEEVVTDEEAREIDLHEWYWYWTARVELKKSFALRGLAFEDRAPDYIHSEHILSVSPALSRFRLEGKTAYDGGPSDVLSDAIKRLVQSYADAEELYDRRNDMRAGW